MNVSVMLEQLNESAFRATVVAPAPLVVEASSRAQAVARIRDMIQERFSGVELIQLEVPVRNAAKDSWALFAGCLRDHPDAAEFEQNIKEYRQEVDRDPLRL